MESSVMSNFRKRVFFGTVFSTAACVLLVVLAAALAHAQMTGTVSPPPTSVPVPVTLNQIPVPVSFNLPIAIWVAWVISIAAGLTAVGLIWRAIIKLSRILIFLTGLEPRILQMEKDLRLLKTNAGINDDE